MQGKHTGAFVADRCGHAACRTLFDKENYAASAAGAADLRCLTTLFPRNCNQFVNQRSRNARSIAATQLPLCAQQPGYPVPVAANKRLPHRTRDACNPLEVAAYTL